jgi:hypothetical protein
LFVRQEHTLRWSAVYHEFVGIDIFVDVHRINDLLGFHFSVIDSRVDVTDLFEGGQAVFLLDTDLLKGKVEVVFHAFNCF